MMRFATSGLVKAILSIALIGAGMFATAQNGQLIDSLTSLLPEKSGKEKALILSDLCWHNRFVDNEKAWEYGNRALEISKRIKFNKGIAQAYNDLGILLIDQSEYNDAVEYFNRSLKIRKELKDTLGVAALYNKIGIVHQLRRDIPDALDAGLKALKIYEDRNMVDELSSCLNNIAILYHNQGNYEKALEYHHRVKKLRKKHNIRYELGATYVNIANVYIDFPDTSAAIQYYDSAITILKDFPEKEGYATALSSMGSYYYNKGEYKTSEEYLEKALTIRKQFGNPTYITTSKIVLGRTYNKLGRKAEAKTLLKEATNTAQELGIKEHMKSAYGAMGEYYEEQLQFDSALKYFKLFNITKDSIVNADVNEKVAEMQTRYETVKKEQEIVRLSQERQIQELKIDQKNTQIALLVLGLLLFVVFGFFFYLRNKTIQERKLNAAIIEEQKKGLRAVLEAMEQERQRIAKDLHDGVGQTLSGIKLSIDRFMNSLQGEAHKKAGEIAGIIDEACEEVRGISHRMMPKALEQSGLVTAIGDMLSKTLRNTGIDHNFEHYAINGQRFDKHIEIGLYRIIQELINNIIKHSNAREVNIQLNKVKNQLVLLVEDNGKGFKFDEEKEGIGLMNIKSRAGSFNGEVNYESSPDKGTVATIRVPVNGGNENTHSG